MRGRISGQCVVGVESHYLSCVVMTFICRVPYSALRRQASRHKTTLKVQSTFGESINSRMYHITSHEGASPIPSTAEPPTAAQSSPFPSAFCSIPFFANR